MIAPADETGGAGIDPFIEAYEDAQARDGHADPADYLPDPDHPLYRAVLCELVRVDLEYGWMRGRPRPLEDYQAEFPTLFRAPGLLRDVAFEEWRLRRQAGQEASPEEYRRRFGVDILDGSPHRSVTPGHDPGSAPEVPPAGSVTPSLLDCDDPQDADRIARALMTLPEAGSVFAGFRLLRELGRGAFGRVYLARQGGLADRLVVLKVSAELSDETEALAQLQHTAIVPIYSAHRDGRLRALCMPYFGATTLADVLRDCRAGTSTGAAIVAALAARRADPDASGAPGPMPETDALQALRRLDGVRAALWIGVRLAEGLAHAHERGIVHRDLKPANVLLTDEGQPMLLDFNLAAVARLRGTAAAALVGGTLPYMAPEALTALRDGPRPADPRSDLYALGLILFELIAGHSPFPIHRGPLAEVLPRVIADRLGPPPRLRPSPRHPDVPPAVASILRRCLEPDPARRYQEARHLREDLQRQLDDLPLRYAPDPSPRERARKWARRHPRLSSATALGVIAAVLIAGLIAASAHRQRRFGPVEAALALRRLADEHEEARILLLDPAADPARRDEGIRACRRALAKYRVLESPSWTRTRLVRDLPAAGQAELRAHVGELLMLWARALARQAAGADPALRAGRARDALGLNALAESCWDPGEVPRVLWAQRSALAALAGDEAEARRARDRAAATPVRSVREYALLALDDDEGAPSAGSFPALAAASRQSPRDFALWMLLGQCHALGARLGEAEDCFTVAMVLRPESPWPYYHRGLVELERAEHEQARLDFDRALDLRPGLAPALVNRALARMGRGDAAGAIEDLTAALGRGAAETRIYFIRARARAQAGDRAGAARDRAEGLRRIPADVESWIARGLARLPDDPAAALADVEEALRLDPKSRSALQDRATILSEHLGRAEEAIAVLDRAVSLHPEFVPARVGRGVLLARLGRRQAAHRDAEEALRRDGSGATTYRVACIYALTSRTDPADRPRALRMLARALGRHESWIRIARTDPDLDALRDRAEFHDLLRAVAAADRPGS